MNGCIRIADGLDLRWIPPWEFDMGSNFHLTVENPEQAMWFVNEAPIHRVRPADGFWMGETEVTVAQFRAFVEDTRHVSTAEVTGRSLGRYEEAEPGKGHWVIGEGLSWRRPGFELDDAQPVMHMSWHDARAFCDWLSFRDSDRAYGLPTEARWEYAASSGGRYRYAWGNEPPSGTQGGNIADRRFGERFPQWNYPVCADYDDGFAFVSPVRTYERNDFGLHDMTGNVWGWMNDWYDEGYYAISPAIDPPGPATGVNHPVQGGGFDWEMSFLRVAKRRNLPPDTTAINVGFRVMAKDKQ